MWQGLLQTLLGMGAMLAGFGSMVGAICAAGAVIYAALQVRASRRQLEHASAATLTSLSNQHNWVVFDRHKDLPPALPAWVSLTDSGWAWRVLHLNHLNIPMLFYGDCKRDLTSKSDFDAWKLMAKNWFDHLASDNQDPQIKDQLKEGLDSLKEVLRPEEGYPEEFRNWLVKNGIVPPNVTTTN